MTVTYTRNIANCNGFGVFWKLLFRWKGSVYKLLWQDLLAYSLCYFTLSAVYRFALPEKGRRIFEKISIQTEQFTDMIPMAFVLGFYVSIVVQRWWAQFEKFTWPDTTCLYISSYMTGTDPRTCAMRRTMMRYINLACVMTYRIKSPAVFNRYPTLKHLQDDGYLTQDELKVLDKLEKSDLHSKYAVPFIWAGRLATKAREEGMIPDDFGLKTIMQEIAKLRLNCGDLLNYDWISIPLVYTQVVTIAVYSFFLATLMGRQYLYQGIENTDGKKHIIDAVIPFYTYLQFIFYMGWLKVAETLVHPFGEDDDDFDVNWFIDRCLEMSYVLVDTMHRSQPATLGSDFWSKRFTVDTDHETIKALSYISREYVSIPVSMPVENHRTEAVNGEGKVYLEIPPNTPSLTVNCRPKRNTESS